MILPPATLGMLGGGQLGRFFVSAAHEMGYKVWVLDPDPHSPAGQIAERPPRRNPSLSFCARLIHSPIPRTTTI